MLILGLDPGSFRTGYGLIERRGSATTLIAAGCLSSPRTLALPQRLARLAADLGALLDGGLPGVAALETPFHGINSRSLIVLAQARGVLLAVLAARGVEIAEHSPAEVKSAVTGSGRADKQQVARMVHLLLGGIAIDAGADVTDALAVALCAAQRLPFDRLRAAVAKARPAAAAAGDDRGPLRRP